MSKWHTLLANSCVVLADGAMATMLFESGLEFGDPPEQWNVLFPGRIRAIHRAYLEVGSQLVLTNTFGGNRFRLKLHDLQDRVAELNRAGAENARAVVKRFSKSFVVAGDVGPSGEILAPLGELEFADAVAGFAEQAAALIAGGVDVIWIETMSDLEEVRAAMEGVRQVSADIPIIATMTFDTRGRTMMGVRPEEAVRTLFAWGAAAAGGNCGNGPEEIVSVIEKMKAAAPGVPLVAKSNAGVPQLVNGKAVYGANPAAMAHYARTVRAAGARVIGGCCGNTPAHVQAMAQALATENYEL